MVVVTTPDSLLASTTPLGPPTKIGDRDPRLDDRRREFLERLVVAKRLDRLGAADSIHARAPPGSPTAMQALATRAGDCNELVEAFVALAHARGLAARPVTGLLYIDGKFYYHAWAEVLLKDWVPGDPMLGQILADAAHVRLGCRASRSEPISPAAGPAWTPNVVVGETNPPQAE